jgi:hypothetical protein
MIPDRATPVVSREAVLKAFPSLSALEKQHRYKPLNVLKAKGMVVVDGDSVTVTARGLLAYDEEY